VAPPAQTSNSPSSQQSDVSSNNNDNTNANSNTNNANNGSSSSSNSFKLPLFAIILIAIIGGILLFVVGSFAYIRKRKRQSESHRRTLRGIDTSYINDQKSTFGITRQSSVDSGVVGLLDSSIMSGTTPMGNNDNGSVSTLDPYLYSASIDATDFRTQPSFSGILYPSTTPNSRPGSGTGSGSGSGSVTNTSPDLTDDAGPRLPTTPPLENRTDSHSSDSSTDHIPHPPQPQPLLRQESPKILLVSSSPLNSEVMVSHSLPRQLPDGSFVVRPGASLPSLLANTPSILITPEPRSVSFELSSVERLYNETLMKMDLRNEIPGSSPSLTSELESPSQSSQLQLQKLSPLQNPPPFRLTSKDAHLIAETFRKELSDPEWKKLKSNPYKTNSSSNTSSNPRCHHQSSLEGDDQTESVQNNPSMKSNLSNDVGISREDQGGDSISSISSRSASLRSHESRKSDKSTSSSGSSLHLPRVEGDEDLFS